MNTSQLSIRPIEAKDCSIISQAFAAQGWNKPIQQYKDYLTLQQTGKRVVLIAEVLGEFTGYLTIKWQSDYPLFKAQNIPEIVDFNVLKKHQRHKIGTLLMDEAERRIQKVSNFAGIGVGMTRDYGAAQILYIRRGYLPDGQGLFSDQGPIIFGSQIEVNDELVLHLIKNLSE